MERKKLLILIVDDNKRFVERIIGLLDELDNIAFINVANDYDAAIRYLEEEKPDLVLLDINLPGKSGIEILRSIKQSGHNCEVIMITNHANEYYRNLCLKLGAKHFLDKSGDFSLVPEIIGNINLN